MMIRHWLARAVLLATVMAPCGAAAQVADGLLGAPCALDADCAAGELGCYLASAELGAPGPAGGLCTAPCLADADCQGINAAAVCFGGVCLEGCTVDSWFGAALDPDKCHGREDMACSSRDPSSPFQVPLSGPACTPRGASDAACGVGLFCNPQSGLCEPAPPTGDPPGAQCDPFGASTCAGVCAGVCGEPCVLVAAIGCSASSAASPRRAAACLSQFGGSGVGDLGLCDMLCNCSSDCPPDTFCEPTDFGGRFDAAGSCTPGPRPSGDPDCLAGSAGAGSELGCAYGPVRSCRTATCLGTAECLPSGEYGDCQCIPSALGGSAEAGEAGEATGGASGGDSGGFANNDAGATPA